MNTMRNRPAGLPGSLQPGPARPLAAVLLTAAVALASALAALPGLAQPLPSLQASGDSPFERVRQRLASGRAPVQAKIVNGEGADIADNPWQVSIGVASAPDPFQGHFCGGALVHPEWVLTAAHCVDKVVGRPEVLHVATGASVLEQAPQRSRVAQVVVHEGYDAQRFRHDIALLRLDRSGPPPSARPVAGPTDDLLVMQRFLPVRVTGWGVSVRQDAQTPVLQSVELPFVPPEVCRTQPAYAPVLTPQMLCLGTDRGDQGSCNGDSGGPATVNFNGQQRLVGVVSFGVKGCAGERAYSVFTRVASYADWVRQRTGGAVDWR